VTTTTQALTALLSSKRPSKLLSALTLQLVRDKLKVLERTNLDKALLR
jgi:hypothetical protein